MVKNTGQPWKECEYAVECYESLNNFYTCTNKKILGFNSFPVILLRRGNHSFVNTAVLFKHAYMSFEDRQNGEKSDTFERTLQREMDKRLSICRACKLYEPKAKYKQLKFDKKSSNKE